MKGISNSKWRHSQFPCQTPITTHAATSQPDLTSTMYQVFSILPDNTLNSSIIMESTTTPLRLPASQYRNSQKKFQLITSRLPRKGADHSHFETSFKLSHNIPPHGSGTTSPNLWPHWSFFSHSSFHHNFKEASRLESKSQFLGIERRFSTWFPLGCIMIEIRIRVGSFEKASHFRNAQFELHLLTAQPPVCEPKSDTFGPPAVWWFFSTPTPRTVQ